MLHCQNESLELLSKKDDPLPSLWNTWTRVLSTDEEEDWPNSLVEELVDNPVTLFPQGGTCIIIVIDNLIEPELCLVVVRNWDWSLPMR